MSQDQGTTSSRRTTSSPVTAPRPKPRRAGTLAAASLAVMVAQIANALPGALNGEYQMTFNALGSQLTWVAAAFMIPVVVFELTFGVLGDKFGHKRLVIGGAALLMVGSLVCVLAPTIQTMWIGSALNGLGAGAIFPASLALVAATAQTMEQRVRGIAIWAGFLSAGSALSPLIGGVLAGAGWWRGAYVVVIVAALAALLLTIARSEEAVSPESRRADIWGQTTFAIGLIAVLYGLTQGAEDGWSQTHILAALIGGVVLLGIFVAIELRVESPLLQLSLFRNRRFTISSLVAVIGMFAFLGACFSTSMWLGPVQHQNALYLGMLFLLLQGPAFVLIPVVARLQVLVSSRWLMTTGFLMMSVGGWIMSGFDVTNRSVSPFVVPTLLVGLGFALTLSPMTAMAVNSVPRQLAGMASATTNMLRDLGFALGPVLVGAIALSTAGSQLLAALPGAGLSPAEFGPAMGIAQGGGAIAVNSLPEGVPGAGAGSLALEALGAGFSHAYLVVAIAALAAALLSWLGLHGSTEPVHAEAEES